MKAVFDSSAYAKRYIEEAGSQEVEDISIRFCGRATNFCGPVGRVKNDASLIARHASTRISIPTRGQHHAG